jgi:enamine deaminase RidA (YjgF/YER057c/UK114 family)
MANDRVNKFNPAGILEQVGEQLNLSQAVVLPPNASLVVTSGQAGVREDGVVPDDTREQIKLAFENAEKTLKTAGVSGGWQDVYHMTFYYINMDEEFLAAWRETRKQYLGDNRPAVTGVQVAGLWENLRVEMTLYAYILRN